MSECLEIEYFPPTDTKYDWNSPCLKKRPWVASIKFHHRDSRSCIMRVWKTTRGYRGTVEFRPLLVGSDDPKYIIKKTKWYKNSRNAVLATESLADRMIAAENLPSWVNEAFELGFRAP